MTVTTQMVQAAIRELIRANVISEYSFEENYVKTWNAVERAIEAAIIASHEVE